VAIRGYRSLRDVVLPLRRVSVVTGANGSGKSSLNRALGLLADCGRGEVIGSLAREGALESVLWAGPRCTRSSARPASPARVWPSTPPWDWGKR
jgi:predicted ATPase